MAIYYCNFKNSHKFLTGPRFKIDALIRPRLGSQTHVKKENHIYHINVANRTRGGVEDKTKRQKKIIEGLREEEKRGREGKEASQ